MIKAKLVNLKDKYFFNKKELENLRNQKIEGFLSIIKRKFYELNVEKILEKNNLYFESLNLVLEKTINSIYYKLQKKSLSFSEKIYPQYHNFLKYYNFYLILDDLRLVIYASKMNLNEEELKELSAHLISDKIMDYLIRKEFDNLLKRLNFKIEENKSEIEIINELSLFILKKLKKYEKYLTTVKLLIGYYNYVLKQKERLLKINLKDFYLGKQLVGEKEFYKKLNNIFNYKDNLDCALAFTLMINKEKSNLIKILHELN